MRYVCPRCGTVSTEGLAIGPGPYCVRCGAEMGLDRVPAQAQKPERPGRKPTPPELRAV